MVVFLTVMALAMLVVGSLVLDMQGYVDSYATEDDAHRREAPPLT